jgi:cysteine synthase
MNALFQETYEYLQSNNFIGKKNADKNLIRAFHDEYLINQFGLGDPIIEYLSEIGDVKLNNGVSIARMDKLNGVFNHKKPIVGGLILKGIIEQSISPNSTKYLVDAGNMNTGYALRYYCEKFGFNGYYIMSSYFPEDMINRLKTNNFEIELAPKSSNLAIEKEFYYYLLSQFKKLSFRKDKHCLWHAKYSHEISILYGKKVAKKLSVLPKILVCGVGAGSTLAFLISIQDYLYKNKKHESLIYIVEHESSPILQNRVKKRIVKDIRYKIKDFKKRSNTEKKEFRELSQRVPHSVIGPHFEELNPFVNESMVSKINGVIVFNDKHWKIASQYLSDNGLPIGNSSVTNLDASIRLSQEGYSVFTIVYEPLRDYYLN